MALNHYGEDEVRRRLTFLPGWQYRDNSLYRRLEFPDFVHAFRFMTAVALEAEKKNHHPNWYNVYNTVEIHLSTHDAGGITDKDFALAEAIDRYLD